MWSIAIDFARVCSRAMRKKYEEEMQAQIKKLKDQRLADIRVRLADVWVRFADIRARFARLGSWGLRGRC
eukprot:2028950-Rhodomonas_salina.6